MTDHEENGRKISYLLLSQLEKILQSLYLGWRAVSKNSQNLQGLKHTLLRLTTILLKALKFVMELPHVCRYSLDSHVSDLRLRFVIAICDFSALMYAIFMSNFLNHFKEIQLSFYISFILFIFKCLLFFICVHLPCTW